MRIRENIVGPYSIRHCEKMDSFREKLWAHPEWIPDLDPGVGLEVIAYLLEIACKGQNVGPIMLGRRALNAIPREWLAERVFDVAARVIDLDDEWEFRRLLEVYSILGHRLAEQLASHGLSSENPEVVEAAKDYLKDPQAFEDLSAGLAEQPLP